VTDVWVADSSRDRTEDYSISGNTTIACALRFHPDADGERHQALAACPACLLRRTCHQADELGTARYGEATVFGGRRIQHGDGL